MIAWPPGALAGRDRRQVYLVNRRGAAGGFAVFALAGFENVVVQDALGSLTNALWDTVWRPANALRACTPQQREK